MTNRTISRLLVIKFYSSFSSATAFSEADIDGNISRVSTVYLHSFMMCLCVSVVVSIIIFRFIVSCIHWIVLKTYLQLDPSFIFRFVLIFTEMS